MGYMGSGKSTLGRLTAAEIGYDFVDFDALIEEGEGNTVRRIFELKGEIYFRKLEAVYLHKVLHLKNTIVSLGGGTPCYGNNLEVIKQAGATTIYVNVPVMELTSRLFKARMHRPVLQHQETREKLEEFVRKHLFERGFYYNQADYKIFYTGQAEMEMVQEIKSILFKDGTVA